MLYVVLPDLAQGTGSNGGPYQAGQPCAQHRHTLDTGLWPHRMRYGSAVRSAPYTYIHICLVTSLATTGPSLSFVGILTPKCQIEHVLRASLSHLASQLHIGSSCICACICARNCSACAETKGRVTGASGATTTVALVHPQRAVFASLGDSLAVLCRCDSSHSCSQAQPHITRTGQ